VSDLLWGFNNNNANNSGSNNVDSNDNDNGIATAMPPPSQLYIREQKGK